MMTSLAGKTTEISIVRSIYYSCICLQLTKVQFQSWLKEKKKMESTAGKGFLYEPTKEFNEIDQKQQLDKTSNNFPKSNQEYFHCSCEHCYIMPSLIENKCCRGVQII